MEIGLATKDSPDCKSVRLPSVDSTFFQGQNLHTNSKLLSVVCTQGNLLRQILLSSEKLHNSLLDLKDVMEDFYEKETQNIDEGKVPTKQMVLERITGKIKNFEYSLELCAPMPNPVCKGKYFHFKIRIAEHNGHSFPLEEKIQLQVSLFSSELPPKVITHNMSGSNMIRGHTISILTYDPKDRKHVAYFKIQLNEVTSHFRNGWVFLVVEPIGKSNFLNEYGYRIKPLVVKNLVIKAKETTCRRWRERGKVQNIMPSLNDYSSPGSSTSGDTSASAQDAENNQFST